MNYTAVPSVELPKTGGGTAAFTDTSPTTATASDVASGKYFFLANGTLATGSASGGGGTGGITQDQYGYLVLDENGGGGGSLEVESGTYTPSQNVYQPTIYFTNVHTSIPAVIVITDADDTSATSSDVSYNNFYWCFTNAEVLFGSGYITTYDTYGDVLYRYHTTGSSSGMSSATIRYDSSQGSDNTSYMRYWADESGFRPYTGSSSRYWIAGRTYKWYAVWKPTS